MTIGYTTAVRVTRPLTLLDFKVKGLRIGRVVGLYLGVCGNQQDIQGRSWTPEASGTEHCKVILFCASSLPLDKLPSQGSLTLLIRHKAHGCLRCRIKKN
ncbi:hypothetical protein ABBQ38_007021 [Trebouxia sp. C0009 RCD-2024]